MDLFNFISFEIPVLFKLEVLQAHVSYTHYNSVLKTKGMCKVIESAVTQENVSKHFSESKFDI